MDTAGSHRAGRSRHRGQPGRRSGDRRGTRRTDAIERAFRRGNAYFAGWTEDDFHDRVASVHYAGRAAASIAGDAHALENSGAIISSFEAACRYGFTDTTGARPDTI